MRLNMWGLLGLMVFVFVLDLSANYNIENGTCRVDPEHKDSYRFEGRYTCTDHIISAYNVTSGSRAVPCHTSPAGPFLVRPGHFEPYKSPLRTSVTTTSILFITAIVLTPIVFLPE